MKAFVRDLVLVVALLGVFLACHSVRNPIGNANATVVQALPIPPLPALAFTENELQCVRNAVYGEARGESFETQVAVAATVITRSKSSKWPDNLCKVVKQPNQYQGYSAKIVLTGEPGAVAWDRAREAVIVAIRQYHSLPWQMREATHFHTYGYKASHSRAAFTQRYGNLLFYTYG